MGKFIIETNNLEKKYKDFIAVDDLDLKVRPGRIYSFLGSNGAGKSTTIKMLLGLIKPTKGQIKIFDKPLAENRMEILKKVGSLVEAPSYYGHLTAYENLEVMRSLLELDKKYIMDALEIVRLTEWKDKQVKKFSLGMKQRLALAQALLSNPEILILDEPTNGLDPAGIHEIRDLIMELPKLTGVTVLISSHILSEIDLIADDVGIIDKGKLVFQGTLQELKSRDDARIRICSKNTEETQQFLQNKGFEVERDKGILYIPHQNVVLELMLKDLISNGQDIYDFTVVKKTLEDIFLDLTKGGNSL